MTYEDILYKLDRIANGDDMNDLEILPVDLRALAVEAELELKRQKEEDN